MKERPLSPFGYAIFCDDIRQEINEKYSLMGIYEGSIVIHSPPPMVFGSLCIFIHYFEPKEIAMTRKGNIKFQIFFPWDSQDRPSMEMPMPFEEIAKSAPPPLPGTDLVSVASFGIPIYLRNFIFHSVGFIRVRAILDGEIIKISAIQVIHQPNLPATL